MAGAAEGGPGSFCGGVVMELIRAFLVGGIICAPGADSVRPYQNDAWSGHGNAGRGGQYLRAGWAFTNPF